MDTPLNNLRALMKHHQITAALVPTADSHGSEYVGAHFAARAYLSGFTGSAGTLLVLEDWAGLWTDGRYFLQAAAQLEDSGITLMRQGEPGVPTIGAHLKDTLKKGDTFAFDGRCLSGWDAAQYKDVLSPLGITVRTELDLVSQVWKERPLLQPQPAWLLSELYAGESRGEKLRRVRGAVEKADCEYFFLTNLEDIAWTLNLRGRDIPCTPVAMAYFALAPKAAFLFVHPGAISPWDEEALATDGVQLRPYGDFYPWAAALPPDARVHLDFKTVNESLLTALPAGASLKNAPSPTIAMKAIKNPTEIANMKKAHEYDGVALCRFLYWLKTQVGKIPITEVSAAEKLEEFRLSNTHYQGPSFAPIIGYGPNGAIIHYSATEGTDATLSPRSFLLADTGGQYLEGTTDCTRTIALGPLDTIQKEHYTAVLQGHLRLSMARFPKGCTGATLDPLARAPLWAMGLDYNHGTGHGVGYFSSVHEGPQSIYWKRAESVPLEPGMITSNEPGLYLPDQYGIRLENLLLCVEWEETSFGPFLAFQPLTLAPFEPTAILPHLLSRDEIMALNQYHSRVYKTIAPHLPPQEAAWLRNTTRPLPLPS